MHPVVPARKGVPELVQPLEHDQRDPYERQVLRRQQAVHRGAKGAPPTNQDAHGGQNEEDPQSQRDP